MKKILILTLALLTLTLPALAENTYALTTIVLETNDDEIICIDFNGNIWVFYDGEDWLVGDVATLTLCSASTDIIFDDEIIDAQYSGWFSPEMIDHWLSHE